MPLLVLGDVFLAPRKETAGVFFIFARVTLTAGSSSIIPAPFANFVKCLIAQHVALNRWRFEFRDVVSASHRLHEVPGPLGRSSITRAHRLTGPLSPPSRSCLANSFSSSLRMSDSMPDTKGVSFSRRQWVR
jgi:hypothetical protein